MVQALATLLGSAACTSQAYKSQSRRVLLNRPKLATGTYR